MKKIFSVQTDLKDYKYPLIKIGVSLLVILLNIFRDKFFVISAQPFNIIVTFLYFLISIASILCIYIAIAELFYVRENRKGIKMAEKAISAKPFSLERIIALLKENDIIEIEIKANEKVLKIGASADNKPTSSVFFDKRFYIEKEEYLKIEEFEKELLKYTKNDEIDVITIDGIKAEK